MLRGFFSLATVSLVSSLAVAAPTPDELAKMLKRVDTAMSIPSDFRMVAVQQQISSNGDQKVWETMTYRRDAEKSLLVIATAPRTEAGKGFMRTGHNLWFYDSSTGKWERRGEDRSFLAKTSRRRDFDQWTLSEEYDATYVGREKIGNIEADQLKLTLKKEVTWEADFPTWNLWLSTTTGLPVKAEQFADSGKMVRTIVYPKYLTKKHPKTGKELTVPQEVRLFDQIDKGTRLQIVVRDVFFEDLDPSLFTKAWVEAHAR